MGGSPLYVFIFYWVITVITTTGYGDFSGGTTIEYLASLVIEFGGLLVFGVLSLMVA